MLNTNPRPLKKTTKKPYLCNVYRTNNPQRSPVRTTPTFKTPSPTKDPEVLYFNDKILRKKNQKKKVLKECSTQTSKTILQLAQDDTQMNGDKPNDNQMSKVEEFLTRDNTQNFVGMQQNNENQNMPLCGFECQNQNVDMVGNGFYPGGPLCPGAFFNYNIEPFPPLDVCNMNTQRTYNLPGPCTYDPNFFYSYTFPVDSEKLANYNLPPDPNAAYPAAGDAQNKQNSPLKIGVQIQFLNDKKTKPKEENLDSGRLSPDSLADSPHEVTHNYSLENCSVSSAPKCLSDLTLEGSCHIQDCIYNKTSLAKPLTQTFLEKNRARIYDASTSSLDELRSKSFVDNYYHPNYIHETIELKSNKVSRKSKFTDTSNSKSINLPDNSFARPRPSAATSTLMRPTFASNSKSQREDVQTANSLIPSMRRGRSISPKPVTNHRKLESSRKIPYIDQSRSDISSETTLVNAVRHPEILRLQRLEEDNSKSDCSYRFSEDLLSLATDFDITNSTINETIIHPAMEKLCESDWKTALRGLAEVVEICRVTDLQLMREYTHTINQRVVHLLRSPRSHVSRAACKAAGHLFEYIKDTKRPTFDEIVDILLHKTADTNKFIRHDANLALDCMVTHISISHAVRALCSKGPHHKNPLVRSATARLLVCAVVIAGTDHLFNPNNNAYTRKTIILNMAKFLEDKNLDTRRIAERLYKVLSKDMRFDIYLRKYLEKDQIEKMRKNLIFIHKN